MTGVLLSFQFFALCSREGHRWRPTEVREEVLLEYSSCARQKRKLRLRAQAFHPLLGKTRAFKPVFCKEQARNLAIASPSSSPIVRNKLLRILSGSPHRWDHA